MHQSDNFATSRDTIRSRMPTTLQTRLLSWLWNITFQIIWCGIIQFLFLWLIHKPKCSTARINSHIAQSPMLVSMCVFLLCWRVEINIYQWTSVSPALNHYNSAFAGAYYHTPPHLLKFILNSPRRNKFPRAWTFNSLSVSISVWVYQIQRLSSAQRLPTNSFGSCLSLSKYIIYTYFCEI